MTMPLFTPTNLFHSQKVQSNGLKNNKYFFRKFIVNLSPTLAGWDFADAGGSSVLRTLNFNLRYFDIFVSTLQFHLDPLSSTHPPQLNTSVPLLDHTFSALELRGVWNWGGPFSKQHFSYFNFFLNFEKIIS